MLSDRIEEGTTGAIASFFFPPSHRKKTRTTSMIEWLNGYLEQTHPRGEDIAEGDLML